MYVPVSDGISITGAHVFFTIDLPLGGLPVSEAQVNSWLVLISLFFFCKFLTHDLKTRNISVRQVIAEWLVKSVEGLVRSNMGEFFMGFGHYIAAIMGLSACSSLLTLVGLFPPTSDINIVGGWAIMTFILITYYKFKAGPWIYIRSFGEPVPFLAPLNIIGEVATPISMAFRHYGNVLSGSIISVLIAALLTNVSKLIFGALPGILGDFPFLRVGLPAVLSVYFDLFSGCLQAFIFAMLTMLYVSGGFPEDEYFKRKRLKEAKKNNNSQVIKNTNGGI
ncbi:MAG: F0F1 ATP synthase subunit A [Clostridiales bacterium]|nr:F0F1 ATP synthase subunit A [Clostridiales bacterium]